MKKTFALMILTLVFFSAVGIVSADCDDFHTLIAGKIYDSPNFETAGPVADATVYVTCNDITHTAVSKSDGTYSVEYASEEGCCNSIVAYAYATKGDVTSDTMNATIQDYTENFDLYLGVINLALIPEFGVIVGAVTLLGAVGVFFLVRRK
jgi:hypothetical protein